MWLFIGGLFIGFLVGYALCVLMVMASERRDW